MSNNWLFVSNPEKDALATRIESGQVQAGTRDFWRAKQNVAAMAPGDRVFHWVTGESGGLAAVSRLMALPEDGQVEYEIEKVLSPLLARAEVLEEVPHPGLQFPRQTNLALDALTASALSELAELEPVWPFQVEDLLRVLGQQLDDPEIRDREGWERVVGPRLLPFLEAVRAVLITAGIPRNLLKLSSHQTTQKTRLYFGSLYLTLAENRRLVVYLGLDKEFQSSLFIGLSEWGSVPSVEATARRWAPIPGLEIRTLRQTMWAAGMALQGVILTSAQLSELSPQKLLARVRKVFVDLYQRSAKTDPSNVLPTLIDLGGKSSQMELLLRSGADGRDCLRLWLEERLQGSPRLWEITPSGKNTAGQSSPRPEEQELPLELVQSESELLHSLRNYASHPERASIDVRTYFVYDSISGWVAPCKFAGLKDMTVKRYRQLLKANPQPTAFDGGRTQKAVQSLLGSPVTQHAQALKHLPPSNEVKIFAWPGDPEERPLLERFQDYLTGMVRGNTSRGPAIHKPLLILAAALSCGYGLELTFESLERVTKKLQRVMGIDYVKVEEPYSRLLPRNKNQGVWSILGPSGEVLEDFPEDNRPAALGTSIAWLHGYEQCLEDPRLRAHVVQTLLQLIGSDALKEHLAAELPQASSAARPVASEAGLADIVSEFSQALWNGHLRFGPQPGHLSFVRSFLVSLATKRFAILAGLSGSGKSQIALRLGEWFGEGQWEMLPVRPDWTGPEALFGYEDALRELVNGVRVWSVPRALKFMLRAARDPERPYLLILDEMNLAHVERYFADILSGMESGQACLPNLLQDGQHWLPGGDTEYLRFPENLFVVGTVNIDETTYMFSPKVLDRANTLEFRVETENLELDLARPRSLNPGSPDAQQGFLRFSRDFVHQSNADFAQSLREVHQILSQAHLEFGHRVFYEALRFEDLYRRAGGSREEALDLQVMQKVLPRLHGGRGKLETPLLDLQKFAEERNLPRTLAKVKRMLHGLQTQQFTSFLE